MTELRGIDPLLQPVTVPLDLMPIFRATVFGDSLYLAQSSQYLFQNIQKHTPFFVQTAKTNLTVIFILDYLMQLIYIIA
jgi:hypothetical protein